MSAVRAADTAEPEHVYVLKRGESLWTVSQALLERPSRWNELRRHNGLVRERQLPPGTRIRIPVSWLKRVDLGVEVLRVSGHAQRLPPGVTQAKPLATGDRLSTGDRVISELQSYVSLRMPDGSIVQIGPGSDVAVHAAQLLGTAATDISFKVHRGRIETRVVPQRDPKSRFEIRTPAAQLGVRGTSFRVTLGADERRTTAEVESGRVNASNPTLAALTSVDLEGGFATIVRTGQAPLPPIALLPAPDLRTLGGVELGPDFDHAFEGVTGAVAYRLQLALDAGFERILDERIIRRPEYRFSRLPQGAYHLRLRAIDANEIEGLDARIAFSVRDLDV